MGKLSPNTRILKALEFNNSSMTVEIGRRVSRCKLCSKQIPANTTRLAFRNNLVRSFPARRGGRVRVISFFYHPECMANFISSTKENEINRLTQCSHCGNDLDHRQFVRVSKTKPVSYESICRQCAYGPHFRYCQHCTLYATRYAASEVVEGDFKGHYLCDYCSDELPVSITIKMQKRMRRAARNENRQEQNS